jgi:(E)-4-hydroxy-3-methylbut-2-enyl-diphosphate synthase
MGPKGIVASTAAMGILPQQGIGDTIRVSLTPEPGGDRTQERVAQEILQTMGLRSFSRSWRPAPAAAAPPPPCSRSWRARSNPMLSALPSGAGNTRAWRASTSRSWVASSMAPAIQARRHRHPLLRTGEFPTAPVFIDGKKAMTLRGPNIATEFKAIVEDYVARRYGQA